MRFDSQMTLEDYSPEYQQFVDKFKPKKTTDDCYTPQRIYDTVLTWCVEEYGIDPNNVVRPFWPGGDYLRFDYPDGCTVVDNPPFSIISKICNDYVNAGIKFFLFSPYLTCFNSLPEKTAHIITGTCIEYENGAQVATSFVTNLENCLARSAPDLAERIDATMAEIKKETKKQMPKYKYPEHVVTASMLGYMAKYGIEFKVEHGRFVRELESQKAKGKTIFGGGYLLSEKAAAEKAAAEKAAAEKAAAVEWELSDFERETIRIIGEEEVDKK